MSKCTLDYAHAPVWCDACWEDSQRVREVNIQADYLTELKRANDFKEWELEQGGRPRPRPAYYPPEPQIKPQPIVTERRGL